jgi:hypothetical protein
MATPSKKYDLRPKANVSRSFYATKPTGATVFWRTFLPWHLWRFVAINLKMMTIIRRSHSAPRP